jgi:hypothetical protein
VSAQALPALITLLLKLAFLGYALRAPRRDASTRLFVTLLVLLALHNLITFAGLNHFLAHGLDEEMKQYGYAYFASIILHMAVVLHLSLRLSVDRWNTVQRIVPLIYLPVPVLEYLLLGTNQLVAGFQLFRDYSILRVPGPNYFLFEIYALIYALAATIYVIYGARGSRASVVNRNRNRWWLVGFAPLVLLHFYLIIANHFGLAKISSTVFVPIALTLFLIVTTYATHQYRLFDITFFVPWSKVRKRKTEFYRRIQTMIAAISELQSIPDLLQRLANTLRCQVALIGGPEPAVAFVEGQDRPLSPDLTFTKFPRALLAQVKHIVVADEIAESRPELYAVMRQSEVGAIVPFKAHGTTDSRWMLLGNHFSNHVYTPLDFKMVERLFAALADRFLDDFVLAKSELAETREELERYKHRLALAWDQTDELRTENHSLRKESAELHADNSLLRRGRLHIVRDDDMPFLPEDVASGRKTMQEYLDRLEAQMIRAALRVAGGNQREAAKLLGIGDLRVLHYMTERYRIDPKEFG